MREAFSTAGSFLVGPTVVLLILIGRSSFSFIDWARRISTINDASAIVYAADCRGVATAPFFRCEARIWRQRGIGAASAGASAASAASAARRISAAVAVTLKRSGSTAPYLR